jgi:hypothetical protein
MNEDGEFVCEEHKPQAAPAQWVVDAKELNVKCDRCEKQAAHYVLEQPL